MSGQLKEVRNRISSVKSTQQITKAMKLVSAAKLKRAQDAITQLRPYAEKLGELLQNIAAAAEGDVALPLATEREVKKLGVIVITGDRGLCGAFNMNIVKSAREVVEETYGNIANENIEIFTVGKKGWEQAKRWGTALNNDFMDLGANGQFDDAAELVDLVTNKFLAGELDKVLVCYAKFKNAAMQDFNATQFLPIEKPASTEASNTAYVFEPEKEALIREIAPKILRTNFFRYLLDTRASEHGARMTAMDKATDNAQELLRDLSLAYNRARQAAITTELTEIVSGAAALEG